VLVASALMTGTLVTGTLVTGILVTATTVGAAGLAPAASAAAPTLGSVLAAAKAAIAKQKAVHLQVDSESSSSSVPEKVVADLGLRSGTESVTEGSSAVRIVVTPAYGYLSGNASGLTKIVGMSSGQAQKVGRDWIVLKAGTSQYTGLATDIRISSVETVLPAAKGTTLSVETSAGHRLYVLKWATAATSSVPALTNTLTLPVAGATLPIQEVATAKGSKQTVTLSKWGEFVQVSAPPARDTIPYSKVQS
jgi:hypothetical protein